MKAHDYTTLAGIKDAMQELKTFADEHCLCCAVSIESGIWYDARIRVYIYNRNEQGRINSRIWNYDEPANEQTIAEAVTLAEDEMTKYCTDDLARAEAELRAAQQALAIAKTRVKNLQK